MIPKYYRAVFNDVPCSPFGRDDIRDNACEPDLYGTQAMRILMGGKQASIISPEEQCTRWEKLRHKTEVISAVINYVNQLGELNNYGNTELEKILVFEKIRQGYYGSEVKEFFCNDDEVPDAIKDKLLNYYVNFINSPDKHSYYEQVLRNLFDEYVTIYFDHHRQKGYVAFKISKSRENEAIERICRILFADRFLDIETVWNCAPFIIDQTDYEICSCGEQLCFTII